MAVDLSFGSTEFPRAQEVRQRLYESGLAGASARYRRLDRLDAFYKCLEYAHLEWDWNGYKADAVEAISPDAIVPQGFTQPGASLKAHQKRPSAPQRLTPLVVDRFTDLLFGEGHKPRVSVEDDPVADDFLQAVLKRSKFWTVMTEARNMGGSMGSALLTVQLRPDQVRKRGRFVIRSHSPKTVHDVIWEDRDALVPAGVLIQYVYFEEVEVLDKSGRPTGRVNQQPYLYRRIIDEAMDVFFEPAAIDGPELPELKVDLRQSYEHGLGRFPGVWVQNLPNGEEIDGVPDCAGAYQIFQTIDLQISQQNKALLVNQDPTIVFKRDPKMEKLNVPIRKGSENAIEVGPGGDAHYMEMGASAQGASREFVKELRSAALKKCKIVDADPQTMAGAGTSGVAMRLLFRPEFSNAGKLREQYGPAIEVIAEIVLDYARRFSDRLKYEGRQTPRFDLPVRTIPGEGGEGVVRVERVPGKGSLISVHWGEFSPPTPSDIQSTVATVASATMANLLDVETGVQLVARAFSLEDVEGLKRRVLAQIEEKKKEAREASSYQGLGLFPEEGEVPDTGPVPPDGTTPSGAEDLG